MATAKPPAAFPHIVRDPHVCGGEPTVAGTRIPVRCIVIEYQRHQDVEWVRQGYPRLDGPRIQEALAFYDAYREEIDSLIAANEAEDEAGA